MDTIKPVPLTEKGRRKLTFDSTGWFMQLLATFFRRLVWLAAVCAVAGTTQAATSDPVGFNRDIRPILVAKCFSCHGPAAKLQKTKLLAVLFP